MSKSSFSVNYGSVGYGHKDFIVQTFGAACILDRERKRQGGKNKCFGLSEKERNRGFENVSEREREVWSKEERNWQKENVRVRYAESGIRKSNLLNWSESVMEKGKRERMGEM